VDYELAQKAGNTLKALAHPDRLLILELLAKERMCVGDIAEHLGIKQSITSQHLALMKDKGVLKCEKEGAKVYYSINNPNAVRLLECIYQNCKPNLEQRGAV